MIRTVLFMCILTTCIAAHVDLETIIVNDKRPGIIYFTHGDCGDKCHTFNTWMQKASQTYEHIDFAEENLFTMRHFDSMRVEDLYTHIVDVPNAVFTFGDSVIPFNREHTQEGVQRWIDDCLFEMDSPVFVGDMDGVEAFRKRFNGSVEIVSNRPLYWASMKKLTSIGFAFRAYNVEPMFFVRSIFGKDYIFAEANRIFHGLVDSILPFAKFSQYDVKEVIAHYATGEVHIVHEGSLPPWWYEFADLYPFTLFVHYQPHETNLPPSSVTCYNRTVEYQRNTTDISIVRWYHDVLHGRASPHYRKSAPLVQDHPTVQEIVGDTLTDMLQHDDLYLALYDDASNTCLDDIGDMSEKYINHTAVHAQFHTGLNDHEALDEGAKPGYIIHYEKGVRKNVIRCI